MRYQYLLILAIALCSISCSDETKEEAPLKEEAPKEEVVVSDQEENSPPLSDAEKELYLRGDQMLKEGNVKAAISEAKKALEANPNMPNARLALGMMYEYVNEMDSAKIYYDMARIEGDAINIVVLK